MAFKNWNRIECNKSPGLKKHNYYLSSKYLHIRIITVFRGQLARVACCPKEFASGTANVYNICAS